MKRIAAVVVVSVGIVVAAVVLYLMFSGPRMRVQPRLVPLQAWTPAVPQGAIPVVSKSLAVPSPEEASQLRNLLPDTEQTRRTGQVYYGYYCAFCHGKTGLGDGPVGDSYTPAPTNLALPRVQALSDGDLYRAILTGAGHEPVLVDVIGPDPRWYIVSYVRSLQSRRTGND